VPETVWAIWRREDYRSRNRESDRRHKPHRELQRTGKVCTYL